MNPGNGIGRLMSSRVKRLVRAGRRVASLRPRHLLPYVTAFHARFSAPQPTSHLVLERHAKNIHGVSVHRDVISYPLTPGVKRVFRGGLVDGRNGRLIAQAVHLSGAASQQEEPADEGFSRDDERMREFRVPVLYGGILYNHFGHFMLESLGRLWAYEHFRDVDPYVAFHPSGGRLDYLDKRRYAYQVFHGLDIPTNRILLLRSRARLADVIVPSDLYGYDQCLQPSDVFVDFIRRFDVPSSLPEPLTDATRVYVSRSELPDSTGRPIGEKLFEDYLRTQGYTIFHPQRHPLHEQLALYSRARQLIFCDGAALHACILLPDLQARVAVVSRRRDPRWNGREIVNQFYGYGQDATWIDAVRYQYQFGLESWEARSFVDWHDVSVSLMDSGFTNARFDAIRKVDFTELVAAEVRDYIGSIRDDPRFAEFLLGLNE